ncbi:MULTISPECIES: hypothetical protein [Halorhodospira]|uniref:hypothetical protein n=1 Tax=Halorhodospira TaxID=85108 RepID=UPI001EE85D35|nr:MULTISPECIES: hypothetical protein [Halorhodospira]MCG5528875.1 hypothetical protein [Halorhodospira halophila]MCG5544261.1 hypothetical protein [Halorhodospira sp. 9628]
MINPIALTRGAISPEQLRAIIAPAMGDELKTGRAVLLKDGRTRVWSIPSQDFTYILKTYRKKSFYERLQDLGRPPERLYDEVTRLKEIGIPFAKPVATARGSDLSLLITLESPGTTLHKTLRADDLAPNILEEAFYLWGLSLGQINRAGTLHIDPSTKNILVHDSGANAVITLVDVDGLRRFRFVPTAVTVYFLGKAFLYTLRSSRFEPDVLTHSAVEHFFCGCAEGLGKTDPYDLRERVARSVFSRIARNQQRFEVERARSLLQAKR